MPMDRDAWTHVRLMLENDPLEGCSSMVHHQDLLTNAWLMPGCKYL
jgi:hypothetical protein